jgi:hypothetical protein
MELIRKPNEDIIRFWRQLSRLAPPLEINAVEKIIKVDVTRIISKSYNWAVSPEILYSSLENVYSPGYKIIFLFRDGENIMFSGMYGFVLELQRSLKIPKENLIVRLFKEVAMPSVTVELFKTETFVDCVLDEQILPIANQTFNKKFLALFGRYSYYRVRCAHYMYTNHRDDTLLSCHDTYDMVRDLIAFDGVTRKDLPPIDWILENCPIQVDRNIERTTYDAIVHNNSLAIDGVASYYDQYFVEVSVETDIFNSHWITEKTTRALRMGKPLILFSGQGALARLRALGFKTFGPWFRESYDNISNTEDRFRAVLNEVSRVANFSIENLRAMAQDMNEVLLHNQQLIRTRRKLNTNKEIIQ